MKQKILNHRSEFLSSKKRMAVIIFMVITGIFALFGIIWSISPIPLQSYTIQIPNSYDPGIDQEKVQFPLNRDLTVSFPAYIRYGDVQEMHIFIDPQMDPLKCDEFCVEKHLTYDNVWMFYQVKTLFSFELNNLQIEPKGDTIFPLTKSTAQEFSWRIKADQSAPVYIKSTVYLVFDSIDKKVNYDQLIFAKELTIPVKKADPLSFPVFRIICIEWVIVSIFSILVNMLYLKREKRYKHLDND